jgi:hypothetical protein
VPHQESECLVVLGIVGTPTEARLVMRRPALRRPEATHVR